MNIGTILLESAAKLAQAGSNTPRLDAEVLVAHALNKDRGWLLAHPETEVQGDSLEKLEQFVLRRARHEPVAYIIGSSEFFGREFAINEHTLVPRPESETMIEMLLEYASQESGVKSLGKLQIIDVGTGSGALGITAISELKKISTTHCDLTPALIDIDKKCIQTAKLNAAKHKVDAFFYDGNLLEPYLDNRKRTVDNNGTESGWVILANLPYVPDSHTINNAAMHEPRYAIFGGSDGLDLYRAMFSQLSSPLYPIPYTLLFTESLPPQHKELAQIAERAGFHQLAEQDFIQIFTNS